LSAAVRDLGPVEIMVNTAGVLDGYFSVDELDESVWRRVIDIDLTGVFLCCKRVLAEMLPRGRGRIINMASVAGLGGTGGGEACRRRPDPADGRRLLATRYHGELRMSRRHPHRTARELSGHTRPRHAGHERARCRGERRSTARTGAKRTARYRPGCRERGVL